MTPSSDARERAERIVDRRIDGNIFTDIRNVLVDDIALALSIPEGHVRDSNGVEKKIIQNRWRCPYCETIYAEYVNGCPRCHLGESGTATSVELVHIVSTRQAAERERGQDNE